MNYIREIAAASFAAGVGICVWQALEGGPVWLWGMAASWALGSITQSIRAGKED